MWGLNGMKLKINPRGKPRPRVVRRGNKSITFSPAWYMEWCKELQSEALINEYKMPDVLANITFVIQMAKSWSKKKKREFDGQPHQSRPDLDNIIKGFQDALSTEDSHIHMYNNIRKVWGYEGMIVIGSDVEGWYDLEGVSIIPYISLQTQWIN